MVGVRPGDPTDRQRRFLRVSVLVFSGLLVAGSVATALVISGGDFARDPAVQATLVGLVVFAYAFHLNETGRTDRGGRLFVAGVFATVWVFTVQIQGSGYLVGNYAYLVTVVLLASFLVPPLETALYALLNLVGVTLLWRTTDLAGTDLVLSLVYQVVFSGMLVLMSAMRRGDATVLGRQADRLAAANEALRASNAERGILLEHTGDAVMHLGPDGRILSGNPAASLWTDGRGGTAWDRLPAPVGETLRRAEGRRVVTVLDLEGGPVRRVGLRAVPVDIPQPGSTVLFLSDRTEEKQRLEEERRALEAGVEVERLRRQSEMQRGFLNMVSHELRTPLTPMKIQLAILLDDPRLPRASLEVLQRNLARLEGLVHGVVDLSRLQEGRLPLHRTPVDAAEVVRHSLASWLPPAERKGLLVRAELEPHTLHADRERLHQVVDHLLGNAIKFTPAGSIRVTLRREGDESVLVVEDTGYGFPPDRAERLFEPFERAEAEQRAVAGVGLGLSICKGIVDAHGGTIRASSGGEGRGARFEVRLPLDPPATDTP